MRRTTRMQRVGLAGLCCGLGLMATSLLWAQQPGAEPAARQQRQAQRQTTGEKHFCLATELIGLSVKAKGEEDAGKIENLIISSEGDVQYLALAAGEASPAARTPAADRAQQPAPGQARPAGAAADSAGKLRLVPWDLAKFHAGPADSQKYVSVEIEKDRLMTAPSFTQQQLMAQESQAQVTAQVDQFFNVRQQRGAARPELDKERNQPNEQNRQLNPQPQQKDN